MKVKANKGFTLIELLAVIVILAIIALIATPMILGVIETARKGSAESSALGYIDAVEKQVAIDMLATEASGKVLGDNVTSIVVGTDDTNLTVKGTKPTSGTVTIDPTTGIISSANLEVKIGGKAYCVAYSSSDSKAKATVKSGDTCPTTTPEENP